MKESSLKGCFCSKEDVVKDKKNVILSLTQDLHHFKSTSKEEILKQVQDDMRSEEILGPRIKTLRGAVNGNTAVQDDNMMEAALNKGSFTAPFRSGFTLIELLVVVLIIGILAAIAVPQYQKAVSKTRAIQAITALSKIREAQELYFLSNNVYTSDLDELDVSIEETYYRYSCPDGIRCFATPKKLSDPIPVFQFYALQRTANADYTALGTRWCYSHPDAEANVKNRQKEICKMLGKPDVAMSGFYVIP